MQTIMPSRERFCVYAAPNVSGPAGFAMAETVALRSGMPREARANGRRHFGKTKYPFFFEHIQCPVRRRRWSGCNSSLRGRAKCAAGDRSALSPAWRAAAQFSVPTKNPCSGKKNSLFFGGTGNRLQAVECFVIGSRNGPKRPGNVRHFLTFPVNFPVLREFAARDTGMAGR